MKTRKLPDDDLWTIKMFSDDGWKELNKKLKGITPHSSEEKLADGFLDFQIIWLDDHDFDMEIQEPSKVKDGKYYYLNNDEWVWTKEDLMESLLTRYCDYLEGD